MTHRALEVAADLGGPATERHHGGGAARPAAPAGGRDTGLVGFDDFPRADLLGDTVVAQDVAEIGRHAASLLSDPIDGDRGTGAPDGSARPPRRPGLGHGRARPALAPPAALRIVLAAHSRRPWVRDRRSGGSARLW